MQLARVVGHGVSTIKHPSMQGWKLLLVQPLTSDGKEDGEPLLAIDNPLKVLVWEDDQGKAWLSYNSADYLYKTIYPRHGLETPPNYAAFAKTLSDITDEATK